MARQLSNLRNIIRNQSGLSQTDGAIPDSMVTEFINRNQQRLHNMRIWPWDIEVTQVNSVAGTSLYALPTRFKRALSVRDNTDRFVLKPATARDLSRWLDQTGIPRFWTIDQGQLRLAPVPSGARTYDFEYQEYPPNLTSDTDESTAPDWAIEWVILQSARSICIRLGMRETARELLIEINRVEQELERNARQMQGGAISVRQDWGRRI